jgi:NAD(P)H-dependent FMN reductase
MLNIGVIVGSTRPGRKAAAIATWVHGLLKSRKDAEFEIVDIEDYKLPLLDEPVPPTMHQYSKAHTKAWSEKLRLSTLTFSSPLNTTIRPQQL